MTSPLFSGKKTKIVATIGPKSSDEETLRQMIRAGMNVARINFSHGAQDEHAARIERVRRIAAEEDTVVAILSDIQGPKIRIGQVKDTGIPLHAGDKVVLTLNEKADGTNNIIPLPHPEFITDVLAGMTLLLDDGNLEFKVDSNNSKELHCTVVIGGNLTSRKGVMAREAKHKMRAITDKDRKDVEFALEQGTDFIAMSFVRSADDVQEMRWLMRHLGHEDVGLIAKIEKHEALDRMESILAGVDGIMVARGDLGLEIGAENVPYHQKRIISLCNKVNKPVITATQMLSSMEHSPRPTRAEASDVYNAIVDGTDAVMLSNETATGEYPVEAVRMMAHIARNAETHLPAGRTQDDKHLEGVERIADAICESTFQVSEALKAKAIVTASLTGFTAQRVAGERPTTPIFCVTPRQSTYRRMALVWGVIPLLVDQFQTIEEMIRVVALQAQAAGIAAQGDIVVIVAGVPFGLGGGTNLLKVHRIGESFPG